MIILPVVGLKYYNNLIKLFKQISPDGNMLDFQHWLKNEFNCEFPLEGELRFIFTDIEDVTAFKLKVFDVFIEY